MIIKVAVFDSAKDNVKKLLKANKIENRIMASHTPTKMLAGGHLAIPKSLSGYKDYYKKRTSQVLDGHNVKHLGERYGKLIKNHPKYTGPK